MEDGCPEMLAFLSILLADQFQHPSSLQLYLTGAVYSLDGSDSLQETMQRNVNFSLEVTVLVAFRAREELSQASYLG